MTSRLTVLNRRVVWCRLTQMLAEAERPSRIQVPVSYILPNFFNPDEFCLIVAGDGKLDYPAQIASQIVGMPERSLVCAAHPFKRRSEEHTSELQSRQYLVC